MIVEAAKRRFKFNDVILEDPNPQFTIDQVRKFYSDQYPELATATMGDHIIDGDTVTYTFSKSVGKFG